MRTLLFLAFMAGFATLGYVYAPRLIEDNYSPNDETRAAPAAPTDSTTAMASPEPMQASVKEITRQMPQAPQPQAKRETKAKATKHKGKKSKHSAALGDDSDGLALDRVDSKDVERVTGLRPLNGEVKNVAEAEPTKAVLPRKQEPLKSRWIDDLSGAKVRFNKKSTNDACAEQYSNCERPAAPKDISVAGVVVKTERLVREPKQALDGNLQQGNYVDHTPAVYVE